MHKTQRKYALLTSWINTASLNILNKCKGEDFMSEQNSYDIAHQLARSITNSQAYNEYLQAQQAIEEDQELKKNILDFRNKQMEMNRLQFVGDEIPTDLVNEVSREFAKLNTKHLAAEFFEAEAKFVQMFNDIQEIIQKAVQAGFIK